MHVNKCTFTQKSSAAIKIVLAGVSITMTKISTFSKKYPHLTKSVADMNLEQSMCKKFTFGRNVRKEKALDALNINHRTHQSRHAKQQTDTRVAGLFPGTYRVKNDHK